MCISRVRYQCRVDYPCTLLLGCWEESSCSSVRKNDSPRAYAQDCCLYSSQMPLAEYMVCTSFPPPVFWPLSTAVGPPAKKRNTASHTLLPVYGSFRCVAICKGAHHPSRSRSHMAKPAQTSLCGLSSYAATSLPILFQRQE